ncbi:Double-stranded RNA-specific adenosine deaminase [Holothuria leucospilota]|uniref:Double-stranded RNA-specific adenosine deaminase n=1 Tax=Holothuria leucospilota TaxID=206669 RepID=A0A9Q1CSM7_HOLLE|nr:Double-stranded RNA-specific adenosine deaminase [Holothuria leucospilota]
MLPHRICSIRDLHKMNEFDKRVEQHVKKVHDLLIMNQPIEPTHVLAAFVCETIGNPTPYVVSIGTGTNWIAHESLTKDGRTVFDSHAEVIARRGFKRYLYNELTKFTPASDNSIFCVSDVSDGKLCLKDKYKIHLYISTSPCGCASPHARHNARDKLTTRKERSYEFLMTDSKISKKHQSWDYVTEQGKLNLRTMTCSDKVCQWNVVGVQGALLSHFLDPIYLTSIIIGSNFIKDRVQLALNRRLESFSREIYNLPEPFCVHSPRIRGRVNIQINDGNKTSLNWYSELGCQVEVNNGFLGRTFFEETSSRLCKKELFTAFSEVCNLGFFHWGRLLEDNPTYLELKENASSYKEAKTALSNYFKSSGFGHWIRKPNEVDTFRLG